jgi:hypothetical protein
MLASIASTFSSPLVHSLTLSFIFFAISKVLVQTKIKPTFFRYLSLIPIESQEWRNVAHIDKIYTKYCTAVTRSMIQVSIIHVPALVVF